MGGDLRLSDGRAPREDGGDGAGGGVGEAVSSGEALRLGPGDKSGPVNNTKYNETNLWGLKIGLKTRVASQLGFRGSVEQQDCQMVSLGMEPGP